MLIQRPLLQTPGTTRHSSISTDHTYRLSSAVGLITVTHFFTKLQTSQPRRLQSIQNAAARLVTGTRRTVTSILQSLHWLPVQQRILFKLAVLVHKCLNGRAPDYLADDCCWTRHRRPGLRSSSSIKLLQVPSTRMMFGDRSFAVNGPRVWNSLWHQFTTQHYQLLYFLIVLRLTSLFNSCGICHLEQMPI